MAYYWITQAQRYIQSLGFGSTLPAVNRRQVAVRINQFGGDNSFFRDNKTDITLGKGGVDDAEDAEVIVHEYGHSVQDAQVPRIRHDRGLRGDRRGLRRLPGGHRVAPRSRPRPTPACVADWDSTSYTSTVPHCLRRVDGTKHYPEDLATPARSMPTARSGRARCGTSASALGAQGGRHDHHPRAVRLHGRHDDARGRRGQTIRTAALYGRAEQKAVTAAFEARGLA